jgi:hypothetical protein
MKIYKCYFDKKDTPYIQDYQPNKPYHTDWNRLPYTKFLGHKVVKIKLFGIFTIYKVEGNR